MYINVDLKDAPDTYEGRIAPQVICDNIVKHHAQHRVLVTSFHKEQIDRFMKFSKGEIAMVLVKQKLLKDLLNLTAC